MTYNPFFPSGHPGLFEGHENINPIREKTAFIPGS